MSTTKEQALSFLASKKTGVLSTLSPIQEPRARLVYYSSDDDFNIYFLTLKDTRKVADLAAYPKAAFTIFDEDVPQTLQLEGDAADITNTPTSDEVIEKLFANLQMNAKYYAPLARFDRSDVVLYRFTPTWLRFGDFTEGHTTKEVLSEIDL